MTKSCCSGRCFFTPETCSRKSKTRFNGIRCVLQQLLPGARPLITGSQGCLVRTGAALLQCRTPQIDTDRFRSPQVIWMPVDAGQHISTQIYRGPPLPLSPHTHSPRTTHTTRRHASTTQPKSLELEAPASKSTPAFDPSPPGNKRPKETSNNCEQWEGHMPH